MNLIKYLAASLLSPAQIAWIAVASVFCALLVGGNVCLILYLKKSRQRKLCTYQLQIKKEKLLEQLQILREGGVANFDGIDDGKLLVVRDMDDDDDKESVAGAQPNYFGVVTREEVDETMDAEILAVDDLSSAAREKLHFTGSEFDHKRYYVRYYLSFEAKLRKASDEVKTRYTELMSEIAQYRVKIKTNFRQQTICKGRKALAMITFSEDELSIAYALNPSEYINTQYRGVDKSGKKRFAQTPMVVSLTSDAKLECAKYLFVQLADAHTIVLTGKPLANQFDLSDKNYGDLFVDDQLQIVILGEVPLNFADDAETDDIEADDAEESAACEEEQIRYNMSYTARIIQSDDELKARYSELKNQILSYEGVFNKITWKREAFYYGKRNCIATFALRGKTLCLFLAVDPTKFDGTKYKVENRSEKSPHAKMPTMYRIKSDRSTKFAKEMINIVFAEKGLNETLDYKPVNFRPVFVSTENLIKKGYIHVNAASERKQSSSSKK